jgi:hypothetical protein
MASGAGDRLDHRALNRATLARQLLLGRVELPVTEAVARLAGLNAQDVEPPYLTLWARLAGFERDALTRARPGGPGGGPGDAAARHPAPGDRGRLPGLAPAAPAGHGPLRAGRPRPGRGRPGGPGRGGPVPLVLVEAWLGRPPTAGSPEDLILRHLTAFGPASVADVQAWSGLTRLREPMERLGGGLRRFRDEHGRQLYDLPDAPGPDPGVASPVRFLPPFDNLLLAHADRTRVMTDGVRRRVCDGAVVEPTVLVDGQVAAVWKLRRDGDRAVVEVEPLGRLAGPEREAVAAEGLRLLRFAATDAADHDVRVG